VCGRRGRTLWARHRTLLSQADCQEQGYQT
jgi:hypothetical protein